jgi:alginate O-acetyltransferase complex protein AlgI
MVFSDQTFLFIFLPVSIGLGVLSSGTRLFPVSILIFSLIFFYWSSGAYALLLVASIVLNFAGGLAVERWRRMSTLMIVVGANVLILFYYKYAYFVLSTLDFGGSVRLQSLAESIVLPIGISFFTFQGISYVVDVWRGEVKAERNPVLFAAYKSFFPQLIAGPIVRYADVHTYFRAPQRSSDMFAAGIARFMVGLCKKVLIADGVAGVADAAFALPGGDLTFASAWLGALAYSIQIYFDFSGYSDMAIGLAMMFGIQFKENFNHPYAASTVTDFWRRWHMSLSAWFRDYLYIPLGGNRESSRRTYANLMFVFLATGIWHGAAWTFLLWGVYHGVFLIAERVLIGARASTAMRLFYFFPVILVGWVLFRAPDIPAFIAHTYAMAMPFAVGAWTLPSTVSVALSPTATGMLIVASAMVLMQGWIPPVGPTIAQMNSSAVRWVRVPFVACSAIACAMYVLPQSFSPFLYFRF